METPDQHIERILVRSLDGQATPEELSQLAEWVKANDANRQYYIQQRRLYEALHEPQIDFETETELRDFKQKHLSPRRTPRRMWYASVSVAASIMLMFGVWYGFVRTQDAQPAIAEHSAQQFSATDTLAETVLADGSQLSIAPKSNVWVDSITAVSRNLRLDGKAYFQVAHDPQRPFSILTGGVRVTVLGTKFQIDQQPSSVHVWVTEGRVRVTDTASGATEILTAGQCCATTATGQLVRDTSRNENFLAWRTRKLEFKDTPLEDALLLLSSTYNIEFKLTGDSLAGQLLNARFDHTPLTDVMSVLAYTLSADLDKQDDTVVISHKVPRAKLPASK